MTTTTTTTWHAQRGSLRCSPALALAVAGCSSPRGAPAGAARPGDAGADDRARQGARARARRPADVAADRVSRASRPCGPSLAVKIENTAVARPQTGLDQADVVWETIVEFDVSRFIAVFHSQVPAEVGPIRSVRPMDPVILAPMHGLLAFSGGQPGILDLVAASGVQMISHDAGRSGDVPDQGPCRAAQRVRRPRRRSGAWPTPTTRHRRGSSSRSPAAPTARRPSWPGRRRARSRSGCRRRPARRGRGTPAAACGCGRRARRPRRPAAGRSCPRSTSCRSPPTTRTRGSAPRAGRPCRPTRWSARATGSSRPGGKTVPVRWKKESDTAPMRLFTADGKPADLAPGNTWVELVPAGSGSLTVG